MTLFSILRLSKASGLARDSTNTEPIFPVSDLGAALPNLNDKGAIRLCHEMWVINLFSLISCGRKIERQIADDTVNAFQPCFSTKWTIVILTIFSI
jgi:hypothetical protein